MPAAGPPSAPPQARGGEVPDPRASHPRLVRPPSPVEAATCAMAWCTVRARLDGHRADLAARQRLRRPGARAAFDDYYAAVLGAGLRRERLMSSTLRWHRRRLCAAVVGRLRVVTSRSHPRRLALAVDGVRLPPPAPCRDQRLPRTLPRASARSVPAGRSGPIAHRPRSMLESAPPPPNTRSCGDQPAHMSLTATVASHPGALSHVHEKDPLTRVSSPCHLTGDHSISGVVTRNVVDGSGLT